MRRSDIPPAVTDYLRRALDEDIGSGDVTTSLLIPENDISHARFIAKDTFILAGLPFAEEVFRILDPLVGWKTFFDDGDRIERGQTIAEIHGSTRTLLVGERVSLNILQRLSGIATFTRRFVEQTRGLKVRIADTRKTVPCMRYLEKYAVRIGGGYNHRFGLSDGILIKTNHVTAVGDLAEAIRRARKAHHLMKIEVEVGTLDDLMTAVRAGADVVMLDNMSVSDLKKAVEMAGEHVLLEASGGVTLENVREIASTGVHIVSVGALTHSATAADISLQFFR